MHTQTGTHHTTHTHTHTHSVIYQGNETEEKKRRKKIKKGQVFKEDLTLGTEL